MLQEQTNYLQQIIQDSKGMVDNVKNYEARVKKFLTKSYADFPVAPNILSHTKYFENMCQGEVNTKMTIPNAHKNSGFSMFNYRGVSALNQSTIEIATIDTLASHGMPVDATLNNAIRMRGNGEPYGSDFRVMIFDMNLPEGHEYTFLWNQGCPAFSGWTRGQFKTQSRVFVNVMAQTGTASINIHSNVIATVTAGKAELGKGWRYKTNSMMGWGGCHRPYISGVGRIKVAVALPYASTGYHGPDNFVWSGFVGKTNGFGRWSHNDVIA